MADDGGYEDESSDVEDDVDSDAQPSSSVANAKFGGGAGGAVGGLRGRTKWGGKGAGQSRMGIRMGMRSSRVGGASLLDSDDDDDATAAAQVPAALTLPLPAAPAARSGALGSGGEGSDEDQREREAQGYGQAGQGLEMEVEAFSEEEIGDRAFGEGKQALRSEETEKQALRSALRSEVAPPTPLPHQPEEEHTSTFASKFGNILLSMPSPPKADEVHASATPSPVSDRSPRGAAAPEEKASNFCKWDNNKEVPPSGLAKFGNVQLRAPSASPSPPPCVSSHGSAGARACPCRPCALTPVLGLCCKAVRRQG